MTGESSPRLSKRQRNLVLHPKKTIILLFLLSWLKYLLHDVDSIPWTTILLQYFLKNFSYFLYLSLLYRLFPLYIFQPFEVEVTFALHGRYFRIPYLTICYFIEFAWFICPIKKMIAAFRILCSQSSLPDVPIQSYHVLYLPLIDFDHQNPHIVILLF